MSKKKVQKIMLVIFIVVGAFLFLMEFQLPLSEEDRGIKQIKGTVVECDFRVLGSSSSGRYSLLFLVEGESESKNLVVNIIDQEMPVYRSLCDDKKNVIAWYEAKKTLLRPKITYFVSEISLSE